MTYENTIVTNRLVFIFDLLCHLAKRKTTFAHVFLPGFYQEVFIQWEIIKKLQSFSVKISVTGEVLPFYEISTKWIIRNFRSRRKIKHKIRRFFTNSLGKHSKSFRYIEIQCFIEFQTKHFPCGEGRGNQKVVTSPACCVGTPCLWIPMWIV